MDLLTSCEKGCWFVKTDDSNGYHHILLNKWSSEMCGLKFGSNVFVANALPFGLTQAAGRFQVKFKNILTSFHA